MPTAENTAAPRKRKEAPSVPPVPSKTRRIITVGVVFALTCAAAMSAPTLYGLAEMAKFPKALAWLLPACLDGYAFTSILFGSRVPAGHPAKGSATKNTRLALMLTVGSNGAYHLLVLARGNLPGWLPIVLLVTVSSLPPFVVDRLLHLYALANGNSSEAPTAGAQVPTERRQAEVPTKAPAADKVPTVPTAPPIRVPIPSSPTLAVGTRTADESADVIDMSSAGAAVRRSLPEWVTLALPHYRQYVEDMGEAPTAPQLADCLADAGYGALKPSRARDVRKATAELAAELGDKAEPEPDRELIGAAR